MKQIIKLVTIATLQYRNRNQLCDIGLHISPT